MGNRKLKTFAQFMEEVPPPMGATPPTNTASGTHIAGLPPDFPPVSNARKQQNIRRRKTARLINNRVV
jgi:hypothetical protein